MLRRTSSVVASLAATATLAAGLSVGLAAPAQASPQGDGADWTLAQLGQDRLFTTTFDGVDYVDHGLTIDAGLSFAELGQGKRTRQVRNALAPHMDGENGYANFGASAVAKGLAWAQVSGADPRSYGGVDWVERLEGHTDESGRISDAFGDGNTIGQAFAVQGLWEAGSAERKAALRFLMEQQCSQGFFRLSFSPADAADQSCGASGDSTPSVDVTALAVLALDTLPARNATARESVTAAKRWLRRQQADSGSFGGGAGTSAANANSTGLAARALGATGACGPASKAARWVRTVQVRGKLGPTAYVRRDKGAIAYDKATYRQGKRTDGITPSSVDQFRRATTQAAAGLRFRRGC